MNVAYIILAHNNPAHLKRLVDRLNTDGASFFIHIDKKTDDATFGSITSLVDGPNIHFVKRHKCYWGDFSIVEATLECMNDILVSGIEFDYAMLLSGQDYPIQTAEEVNNFLLNSNDMSYIEVKPMKKHGLYRFEKWHYRIFQYKKTNASHVINKAWKVASSLIPIKRKIPRGFSPFCGSQWWCFTDECVKSIIEFVRENGQFVRFFKKTHIPDEMFFQTIIMNTQLRNKVISDHLHYIDWNRKSSRGSPAVLGKDDFEKMTTSGKLIARKFSDDTVILDMLDNAQNASRIAKEG